MWVYFWIHHSVPLINMSACVPILIIVSLTYCLKSGRVMCPALLFLLRIALTIREGNGTPLQYSCLENPMDGGTWWAEVHEVAKSQTWLSDFNFTFHFRVLEKEMATHPRVLAWRIPGTEEPGGLPSMGSHRVGHNWSDLAAAAAAALTILNLYGPI